jgi:ATP-dependent Clp protease adaptor protein ClpS
MAHVRPGIHEEISSEARREVEEPPLYKVFLLNDDYTTMEFVVSILKLVFKKTEEDAVAVMLNVHREGMGLCGVYPYEIAETKVNTVHTLAVENGFPLKCIMEKE